jgi:putative ABC transport system permease protein
MFKNYLVIAWRNVIRNKIYSFINIAGLSIGLACAMLIMLYNKDEVSYDRFHEDATQIYRVTMQHIDKDGKKQPGGGSTGLFQGPKFTEGVPEVSSYIRYQSDRADIKKGTEIFSEDVYYTDSNFFSFFSFPLIEGDPKSALKEPKSIVLSEDAAKKYFGTVNAAGNVLQIKTGDAFEPYLVSAVARKTPQNSSVKFDYLLPLQVSPETMANADNWFNVFLNTFVKVKPGADPSLVQSKIQTVYQNDSKERKIILEKKFGFMGEVTHFLQPITDMHLSVDFGADNGLKDASKPMYTYILSGIAFFILLIACINFVNLTIARSLKRAKEIGIRKVVGSERRQLIIQFLGESYVICLFAFLLALLLVQLVLPIFNELSNKALALSYLFDFKLITGYITLFIATGFLAGFYPAMVLSNFNPVQTLYSRFKLAGKNYLQKALVVLQFALATLLIIATTTIYYQFNYLTSKALGYDDDNVAVLVNNRFSRDEAKKFKEYLKRNTGISDVAFKNGGGWGTIAKINGETQMDFAYETVDESYLPLYKIPVVQGRNFSADFPSDSSNSVLVNETFVKKAGWKNPIGEKVNFWYNNEVYTVVGVVKDHHYQSLNETIGAQLFTMKPDNPFGLVMIKIKQGAETESLKYIQAGFKSFFPLNPYVYDFKDLLNQKQYEAEAKWKQMMLFGAILTIFISCIGLFGLTVLAAEKRTREIGIRKVLGASVSGVAVSLSKDFLKLVVISLFIAIPVAWIAGNKWLESYPYRISLNAGMFIMAGVLVVAIAILTVSFQAIKAAVANPVKSLRSE